VKRGGSIFGHGKQVAGEIGDQTGGVVRGPLGTDVALKKSIVGCWMVKEMLLRVKPP
jgi:hypothetical protein